MTDILKKQKLTIGEFSRFCQVTVKTLRHYDKLGLLVPSEVDEWTHYRYYDVAQMQQLNAILRLKNLGFSLDEIGALLQEGTHKPSIMQIEAKEQLIESQVKDLQSRLSALKVLGNSIKRVNAMEGIFVQPLPSIIVASWRRVLKHREDLTPIFTKIINPEIQRIGCKRTLPIYGFVIEHEREYKSEDIDTEYCLQVDEMYHETPVVRFRRLPEEPMAVCLKHIGTYESFGETYAQVRRYIEENGYQAADHYRIQFEDSIQNQRYPERYVTVLQVPVTCNGCL